MIVHDLYQKRVLFIQNNEEREKKTNCANGAFTLKS